MNRKIFMERLRELLRDIPSDEREEALAYYESYFDEAGAEREYEVIRELESPEKVAATIKEDLFENVQENPNALLTGEATRNESAYEDRKKEKKHDKTTKIILIVIIAILTFPLWIAVVAALFGILVGIFGALFGILVGIIAGTGAVLITGVVLFCLGFGGCITGNAAVGIFMMGVGLILLAVGILAVICIAWICVKLIPLLCKGIANLWNRVFHRRKEKAV